jgi:hypothetical protein
MCDTVTTTIGTELLFENEQVRVWQMVLAPGEASPLHRHEHDYLFVYTTPSRITLFQESVEQGTSEYDDGYVRYISVGDGLPPHQIRNDAGETHRQILVELKGPSRTAAPAAADNGRRL